MRRQYSKPNMSVEMFEANEYIAACSTTSETIPSYQTGVLYIEKNDKPGCQWGDLVLAENMNSGCYHDKNNITIKQGQFETYWTEQVYDVNYHEYYKHGKKKYHIIGGTSVTNASN